MDTPLITRDSLPDDGWGWYRKVLLTKLREMHGPFAVLTREGRSAYAGGYRAVDSAGWPYPVAGDEANAIYEFVRKAES